MNTDPSARRTVEERHSGDGRIVAEVERDPDGRVVWTRFTTYDAAGEVLRVSSSELADPAPVDPNEPASIRHDCDETWVHGVLRDRYNFLSYRFERDGAAIYCRAYLDSPDEVSIDPPHVAGEDGRCQADAPELERDVMLYLARRFRVITAPHPRFGYRPTWLAARPRGWPSDQPWPPGYDATEPPDKPPRLSPPPRRDADIA